MNIAVRYYTRSGNTKKLADAVALAASVESKDITCPLDGKVDILFLGCSYYTQYITMMVMWEQKEITVKALGEKILYKILGSKDEE